MSSNYNEQYSRKNNIKVFNFPRREKQNLRQDFINLVKGDLNVTLEERDVVAIHRLPAEHEPSPLIVRLFSSDVKRSVMRVRKELKGRVKFVDDVTQMNMELIKRRERSQRFDQVWYFNCGIYGRMDYRRSFRCMMTLTLNSNNGLHNVLVRNFKFLMLKNI